ncbi:hypothetical protein E2C01_069417 [Portunus trituberculatus]|uniref:Uncharacterized protein n=1 Tax=Portunus trituberculatus TaxID=210409 RepID=A0A5B7HYH4_PORTR|nr:hypothetical protein [Portunus trituberculatus]
MEGKNLANTPSLLKANLIFLIGKTCLKLNYIEAKVLVLGLKEMKVRGVIEARSGKAGQEDKGGIDEVR